MFYSKIGFVGFVRVRIVESVGVDFYANSYLWENSIASLARLNQMRECSAHFDQMRVYCTNTRTCNNINVINDMNTSLIEVKREQLFVRIIMCIKFFHKNP